MISLLHRVHFQKIFEAFEKFKQSEHLFTVFTLPSEVLKAHKIQMGIIIVLNLMLNCILKLNIYFVSFI